MSAGWLSRIDAVEPKVHAFLHVDRSATGSGAGALAGMTVAIKDLIHVEGMPTTAGSKILEGFMPPFSATVVERLRAAGAVLVGKTNLDEFGMGSSCENSAYGPTMNPYDLKRTPGGSSGGSAAAVAAGMCEAALGTDTGGSIRLPAAFCNLVGLRPTYGRVSRWGSVAFASSLDQIGPMARTVDVCERVFHVIAGPDDRDATSARVPPPARTDVGLKGLRIGLPREYFGEGLAPEVERAVRAAATWYEGQGAKLVEVSLPHTNAALATYYLLAPSEASSNLARYDGVRFGRRADGVKGLRDMYERTRSEGFGAEVKRRIMLGTFALSAGYYDAYYVKAQKVRTLVRRDFDAALSKADVLLTPVSPTPAFELGAVKSPMALYLMDVFTIPSALAGLPGLALPGGFTDAGLPIGLQLTGRPFAEGELFSVARSYERAHPWHERTPALESS
ncbi:MAG: Asp-tRNA(Asn)/Glu-tRNA(Gln) amidotransferase subunit GatA [Myxococcaceae bacterium]|nr:Asp-tRNA(Asn)/Glu-tRNA(Gln) amidotransferase subunit GatA [Myxococcaceae bacterium]